MESGGARGGDHGSYHLGQLRPSLWSFGGGGGMPWPATAQRSSSSYTCGYCKRDFRSAQALGGHMNVHRRERARLRHYYSCAPIHRVLPNLNFAPPQYYCTSDTTTTTTPRAVYSFFSTAAADTATSTAVKDDAVEVNFDLGVAGGFGDGGGGGDGGLDLELRLGCA
ncbi:unnamed protein product [Alopecurus aequalis]